MNIEYFSFAEMTATTKKIINTPNWEQIKNLTRLASLLDAVRREFGRPIRINSGFRCEKLNKAVGGAKTSAHLKGLAADICAWSGLERDNRLLLALLEERMTDIDQLISYHKIAGDRYSQIWFIHVGIVSEGKNPRKMRLVK